ncbi:Homoserine dehydrogenase [Massospora cicadina]|nr:Homoserine dehydrogenase [Massospora cicadina]
MLLRSRTDAFEINENWVVQQDLTLPSDIQSFVAQFADSYANSAMVLVDCTSDESVARLYPNWLKNGFHVVTPNKKAFSGELSLYKEILAASQKHARFCYHESTVGAGLPVLETLKALVHTGDKIVKIEGIFSGTLSYLFNNFSKASEDRTAFSDIVKVAKAKGFTEPDPRDDLNGMDVARKFLQFMERLSDFDAHFDKLNSEAASKNQVLRYVGMINKDGIGLVKLMR